MSIANVRKALREGAGPEFTISDVTLGYGLGGREQILKFHVKHNSPKSKKSETTKIVTIGGSEDPVVQARIIGQNLLEEFT